MYGSLRYKDTGSPLQNEPPKCVMAFKARYRIEAVQIIVSADEDSSGESKAEDNNTGSGGDNSGEENGGSAPTTPYLWCTL